MYEAGREQNRLQPGLEKRTLSPDIITQGYQVRSVPKGRKPGSATKPESWSLQMLLGWVLTSLTCGQLYIWIFRIIPKHIIRNPDGQGETAKKRIVFYCSMSMI